MSKKTLFDVADEVILLEDIIFPEDKTKCAHIGLDSTFIPIKEEDRLIGCIQKCTNCSTLVKHYCKDGCAICGVEEDQQTGQLISILPCDLSENQKILKGLKRFNFETERWS